MNGDAPQVERVTLQQRRVAFLGGRLNYFRVTATETFLRRVLNVHAVAAVLAGVSGVAMLADKPAWRPSTSRLVSRSRRSRSFAADAENQRGSSPISGTSRAAGGPSTVLGHHPLITPKAMEVIPINNISQSGHHRLMIRLTIDMAADPFLPLIGALLPATRRRGRSVLQSRNGENERSLGVVTVPQILLPPKACPGL
jgi:hypothetical protein